MDVAKKLTLEVRKELMDQAYSNMRTSSIALLINGLIVAIVMWGNGREKIIIV